MSSAVTLGAGGFFSTLRVGDAILPRLANAGPNAGAFVDSWAAGLASVTHHPVFNRFQPWQGEVDPGWSVNFLGVRARDGFTSGMTKVHSSTRRRVETQFPPLDEEYLEWIDVLEAVRAATGRFTMIELARGTAAGS